MVEHYDVIIVGAGAAGLAAARVLKAHEKSVKILESSSAVGGRAQTRKTSNTKKNYDAGAHWLHYGDLNIYKNYALKLFEQGIDFEVKKADDKYVIFTKKKHDPDDPLSNLYEDEWVEEFTTEARHLEYLMAQYVPDEKISLYDAALIASELYETDPYIPNTRIERFPEFVAGFALLFGNFDAGKDWNSVSHTDYGQAPQYVSVPPPLRNDYICLRGFGELIKYAARNELDDIEHNSKVKSVSFDSVLGRVDAYVNGDMVDEPSFTANACIVTSSASLLANQEIVVSGLSDECIEAYKNITMGSYFRVILDFDVDVFRKYKKNNQTSIYAFSMPECKSIACAGEVREPVYTSNVGGTNVVFVDFGGKHAIEAYASSKKNMASFKESVINDLKYKLGDDIPKPASFDTTWWEDDPNYLGAYGSMNVEDIEARDIINRNEHGFSHVSRRIYLAGEAMSRSEWGTVSGAHKMGCSVAKKILRETFGHKRVLEDDCDAGDTKLKKHQYNCDYFY